MSTGYDGIRWGAPKAYRKFCQERTVHDTDMVAPAKALNGQPREHAEYKDGKLHGKYFSWYESGVIELEGEYAHGEKRDGCVTLGIDTTKGVCAGGW